jgi:hypothetical protein
MESLPATLTLGPVGSKHFPLSRPSLTRRPPSPLKGGGERNVALACEFLSYAVPWGGESYEQGRNAGWSKELSSRPRPA